jgi:hypothetical protein
MCFPKAPKPPKVDETGQKEADIAATRDRIQAEQDNAILKAENKERRMEDALALLQGRIGRRSLFSGGQGGRGFPVGGPPSTRPPRPRGPRSPAQGLGRGLLGLPSAPSPGGAGGGVRGARGIGLRRDSLFGRGR